MPDRLKPPRLTKTTAPPRPPPLDPTVVTLHVYVKETQRRLCTLRLPQQTTLARVRAAIVEKTKSIMMAKLNLTENQCRPKVITLLQRNRITDEYEDCEGPNCYKLAHLGMVNGRAHRLTAQFERWRVFLTKQQRSDILDRLERAVGSLYPQEFLPMALNMAPNLTFD